jgi:MFS family permease
LHWEQTIKGLIFFWWALIQNVSPVIMGGFADRFGRKKIMYITSILIVSGFILLSFFRSFYPFLFSTLLLGLGMGIFKPALQGEISNNIRDNNSSLGWGIYVTFVNIAYFLGPTCSVFLKSISWNWVFWGSAIVHSTIFILLLFIKETPKNTIIKNSKQIFIESIDILKNTFRNIIRPEVIIFLVFVTGFTLNHMQFYETLPNFVVDWSNTSEIAKHLPAFMQLQTNRGIMVSFEWIYNINSTMLVLLVAFSSWITKNRSLLRMCSLGIILAAIGLFIAGRTMNGYFLILGVFILAIGEIIITPRISEYFSNIAPANAKSQYLGYANLAWAFGLSGGGIVGGFLYQHLGEKSSFAIDYLSKKFAMQNVLPSDAMNILCQQTGLSPTDATQLLWNIYNPWHFWIPFFIIGILGAIGLFIFAKNRLLIKKYN